MALPLAHKGHPTSLYTTKKKLNFMTMIRGMCRAPLLEFHAERSFSLIMTKNIVKVLHPGKRSHGIESITCTIYRQRNLLRNSSPKKKKLLLGNPSVC